MQQFTDGLTDRYWHMHSTKYTFSQNPKGLKPYKFYNLIDLVSDAQWNPNGNYALIYSNDDLFYYHYFYLGCNNIYIDILLTANGFLLIVKIQFARYII